MLLTAPLPLKILSQVTEQRSNTRKHMSELPSFGYELFLFSDSWNAGVVILFIT